jgi:hypothetical protein
MNRLQLHLDRAGRWLAAVLLVIALTGLALVPAAASPLEDAKKAGLIGEQPDGYVGLVTGSAPANVVALVKDVNVKRRAAYQTGRSPPRNRSRSRTWRRSPPRRSTPWRSLAITC